MKITLYNAVSADGFIATEDGDSNWVADSDVQIFEREVQRVGCVIVGRKTFDQYYDDLYPIENVVNVVITSDRERASEVTNVLFTSETPTNIVNDIKARRVEEALLIGGGTANASFLQYGLIDEVILSVHPIILGQGIRLFEIERAKVELRRLSTTELGDGVVQIRYRVVK